jgi:UDP-GlcNAc:undecaprenyl-phosphate GlcNAc-1-phosphate transferase
MLAFFGDQYSIIDILKYYWPVFPVALIIGLITTPICLKIALRFNIVDMPDDQMKTHKEPTPYLGGLAILVGLLAGIWIGMWIIITNPIERLSDISETSNLNSDLKPWFLLAGIALGATIACITGLLDDLLDLSPKQKLFGQTIAAFVIFSVGIRPNFIHLFTYVNIDLPPWLNLTLGFPAVLFMILGATNSLNLLDGLDGLCAGVTSLITSSYLLLALILASWGHSPIGDPIRLILCLSLFGGALGFLPMNRHPAKIFMGDCGSLLLGFIVGTLILLNMEQFGRWSIASIVIFGLPILDTAVTIMRRVLNGKPIMVSDRGHIYDQFIDRGLGLKKSVRICYILALGYGFLGLLISFIRFRYSIVAFLIIVLISAFGVWKFDFLKMKNVPNQQTEEDLV